MDVLRTPVATFVLASLFVLVQTAAPWMHVGCQHDHSHCQAEQHQHDQHQHHSCSCQQHPRTDSKLAEGSAEHDHIHAAHDCAACRFLASWSHTATPFQFEQSERLGVVADPTNPVSLPTELVGRYRSRAPPLS